MPMRGIAAGKTRLARVLDPLERMRLNRRLLGNTLAAIAATRLDPRRCIVVSGCARTLAMARAAGMRTLVEPRPRAGLNAAIRGGIAHARRRGARRFLVLPADLPLLNAADLARLAMRHTPGTRLKIVPDRADSGTNALLVERRAAITLRFGDASLLGHRRSSAVAPWSITVCRIPSLALDLDMPEDLEYWRALRAASPRRYRMV